MEAKVSGIVCLQNLGVCRLSHSFCTPVTSHPNPSGTIIKILNVKTAPEEIVGLCSRVRLDMAGSIGEGNLG